MHLFAFAKAGLSCIQDKYATFDDERETVLASLNQKVRKEREKAYSKCKKEIVAQLKIETEESNKNNMSGTKRKTINENNEEKINELVMERLPLEYVYAYRQKSLCRNPHLQKTICLDCSLIKYTFNTWIILDIG